MNIKHDSSIFFSGALTLIEGKLYLELQNFSFICNSTSTKQMPWSLKSTQISDNSISTSTNTARSIHNLNKKPANTITDLEQHKNSPTSPTFANKNPFIPMSVEKRPKFLYKIKQKLPDITSNTISDLEVIEENSSTPPVSPNKNPPTLISAKRKTRSSVADLGLKEVEENAFTPPTLANKNPPTPISTKRKTRSSVVDSGLEEVEENASTPLTLANKNHPLLQREKLDLHTKLTKRYKTCRYCFQHDFCNKFRSRKSLRK
jgi:hypothetical protein